MKTLLMVCALFIAINAFGQTVVVKKKFVADSIIHNWRAYSLQEIKDTLASLGVKFDEKSGVNSKDEKVIRLELSQVVFLDEDFDECILAFKPVGKDNRYNREQFHLNAVMIKTTRNPSNKWTVACYRLIKSDLKEVFGKPTDETKVSVKISSETDSDLLMDDIENEITTVYCQWKVKKNKLSANVYINSDGLINLFVGNLY